MKKKKWSKHSKPYLSPAPVEPRKTMTVVKNVFYETFSIEDTDNDVTLADLPIPDGVDFKDVKVRFHSGSEYDCTLEFYQQEVVEKENPYYDHKLKLYEKSFAKWEAEKAAHEVELKEWKAWVKAEEAKDEEKQLKAAEKLLKKHGKTVT